MADESSKPSAPEAAPAVPAPEEPRISIEDFAKIQMRVGQVIEAEKVENSRKLVHRHGAAGHRAVQ